MKIAVTMNQIRKRLENLWWGFGRKRVKMLLFDQTLLKAGDMDKGSEKS